MVVEQLMLSIPEVFIYKVPPLRSASGHRAEEWDLANPMTTGCCRLYQSDEQLRVALYALIDATSANRTDDNIKLFGECLVPNTISSANMATSITKYIDGVIDSSRYYVLRLTNKQGQTAMIGVGFRDREVSFDFKTVINEFIKYVDRTHALAGGEGAGSTEADSQLPVPDCMDDDGESSGAAAAGYAGVGAGPIGSSAAGVGTCAVRDLSLKEGQTIRIKLGNSRAGSDPAPKPKPNASSGTSSGLLPPPVASIRLPKPAGAVPAQVAAPAAVQSVSDDEFDDFVSA